jgi:hypothetical protein
VEGIDSVSYGQIVGQEKWVEVFLEVKAIRKGTLTHPFLMQPDCLEDIHYSYF